MNPHRLFKPLRSLIAAGFILAVSASAVAQTLPAQLTDPQFWKISSESSEPDGTFRSDNLLSNEIYFQYVIPELTKTAKAGRVYMGVGPEQNFTYIVATQPKMAVIVDIRRGNLDLHLMYKALFELSKDRAEFVSRLFSRPRPDGLGPKSPAKEIFTAFADVQPNEKLYEANLKAIEDQLRVKHGFPLSIGDLQGIEYVFNSFYKYGLTINYSSSSGGIGGPGGGGNNRVTYRDLMGATDEAGHSLSYLASEENFGFMKNLESKNLLIPVVGNFAGPKAIRAVGTYLKSMNATVSAFYLSNVEMYLQMDGIWDDFCANASALPLDATSTFIRSARGNNVNRGVGLMSELGNMLSDLKACSTAQK